MEEIEFRDFSFAYPGCDEYVLKQISLTVHPSEFIVICGKSGCGKSTLLRQLKKSMIPYERSEGKVLYRGQPVEEMGQREAVSEIGFVSQSPENQLNL